MKTQACTSATLAIRLALALVLCALALALRPAPASAATCKWKSATSGNWNTAGNWVDCPGGVPGSSDDVVIDATGADYTVTVSDNRSANSITLNSANATLVIQGDAKANIALWVGNGLMNAGTIWLRSHYYVGWYHADLTVASGTFVNQGSFNTDSIDGTISANLSNSGEVHIYQNIAMNGTWTNTGAFTIAGGVTLSASSGDVFNQDGGTLTVDGAFYMNLTTFNFDGGAVAGSTYPRLDNATLNFGPEAGQTGTIRFTREWNYMSGDVPANVTVLIQGIDNNIYSKVTAASGFINAGTITLLSHYAVGWYPSHLTVSSGALTNQGTINAGSDGGSISTDFTNTGAVNINANTTFSKAGGTYTNNGLTVVASGVDLTVSGTLSNNGELRKTKSVTGSSNVTFFNTGGYGGVIINANSADLGSTVVSIEGNQNCTTTPGETVRRCFDIAPTNTSDRNATITFYFTGSEIPDGQSCANMNGFHWDSSAWQLLTLDTRNCGSDPHLVRVKNVGSFSPFVIKQVLPATATPTITPTPTPTPTPTAAATHTPTATPTLPLAATLGDFSAAAIENGIRVTWETVSELDNLGFNLYRGLTPLAPDLQLNSVLIPSQGPGSAQGFVYTHDDLDVLSGLTYSYWVETVDVHGVTSRYGPVSTTYNAPTAVTLAGGAPAPASGGWLLLALTLAAGVGAAAALQT